MASNPCHEELSAFWSCACSASVKYCSSCILQHMQNGDSRHEVSYDGPGGQFLCGLCKCHTPDAVSCRYPVCVCRACLSRFGVMGPGAVSVPEMHAKAAAAEVNVKLQYEQSGSVHPAALGSGSLQALIMQRRNEVRQHLTLAVENMNSFEEITAQAIYLERKLADTEERLKKTEALLQGSGGGGGRIDDSQIISAFGKLEGVVRENEKLKGENLRLGERLQQVEKQLADQTSLNQKIEQLSTEVTNLKLELNQAMQHEIEVSAKRTTQQLQETLQEQLQETARVAAQSVSDVIPLVAHLHVDNEDMDDAAMEGLFKLASLGISGQIPSAEMRFVARVSLKLAKFLGPCEDMGKFSEKLRSVILKNSERGITILRSLENIYAKTKEHATAKDFLKGLMRLTGTAQFDDLLSVASRFSSVLDIKPLCEFELAVSTFFAANSEHLAEWRQILMTLPVVWSNQEKAKNCFSVLTAAIASTKFDSAYLPLLKMMQLYQPQNPENFLEFVKRASNLLKTDPPKTQLLILIEELLRIIELKLPESQVLHERIFTAMKLVSENGEDIESLGLLVSAMRPDAPNSTTIHSFVDLFGLFLTEEKLKKFTSDMLAWIFPGSQLKADINLSGLVINALQQSKASEEVALLMASLFLELAQTEALDVERNLKGMIDRELDIVKVTNFCKTLMSHFLKSSSASEIKVLVDAMLLLLDASENKSEAAAQVCKLLCENMSAEVLLCLKCFSKMSARQIADAAPFTREALSCLSIETERTVLLTLLQDFLDFLTPDKQSFILAAKAVSVWRIGKARKPGNLKTYTFCSYILKSLQEGGLKVTLDELFAIFDHEGLTYGITMKLAELIADGHVTKATYSRILKTIGKLQGTEVLEDIIGKLDTLEAKSQVLLLDFLFALCDAKPAEIQQIAQSLLAFLEKAEAVPLLNTLTSISEFGLVCNLLDIAQQAINLKSVEVCGQLASMFEKFESQDVFETSISKNLKAAIINRPDDISRLLPNMLVLLQKTEDRMAAFEVRLLNELAERPDATELLSFVADAAKELLLHPVQPEYVIAFGELLMLVRDPNQLNVIKQLQAGFAQQKDKLVELLNRAQGRVTLQDVEALIPQHSQEKELVSVQQGFIRFFNLQTETWNQQTNLQRQIQCNSGIGSIYVILDDGKIFCSGGLNSGYSITNTYILGRDGSVTDLPAMNVARNSHGMIFIKSNRTVYVFGGYDYSRVNTCEKFDVKVQAPAWKWTNLPTMREARCYFNPCLFAGVIYLCGYTSGSLLMEAFVLQQETFDTTFNVQIPYNDWCCLFVVGDALVVHSYTHVSTFRKGAGNQLVETRVQKKANWSLNLNTQPFIDQASKKAYISYSNQCYIFHMETGEKLNTKS